MTIATLDAVVQLARVSVRLGPSTACQESRELGRPLSTEEFGTFCPPTP